MTEFNTTLLREKFVIRNSSASKPQGEPLIALSNRLALPLVSENGKLREDFIIRAQTMHLAVRYGSLMAGDFRRKGPLMERMQTFDWAGTYKDLVRGYEDKWNPAHWLAVYHKGQVVFQAGAGKRHPFLDIIEQCDIRNNGDYDRSIAIAKEAFRQAGKAVQIEHDSNIAMLVTVNAKRDMAKCAAIVRGPDKRTTFNFTVRPKDDKPISPPHCMNVAAAFLEGIQVAFSVGVARQKLKLQLIGPYTAEAKRGEEGGSLLGKLNLTINQFENLVDVAYRPERPDFARMIDEAGAFARKMHELETARREAEESDALAQKALAEAEAESRDPALTPGEESASHSLP